MGFADRTGVQGVAWEGWVGARARGKGQNVGGSLEARAVIPWRDAV